MDRGMFHILTHIYCIGIRNKIKLYKIKNLKSHSRNLDTLLHHIHLAVHPIPISTLLKMINFHQHHCLPRAFLLSPHRAILPQAHQPFRVLPVTLGCFCLPANSENKSCWPMKKQGDFSGTPVDVPSDVGNVVTVYWEFVPLGAWGRPPLSVSQSVSQSVGKQNGLPRIGQEGKGWRWVMGLLM